MTKYKSSYSDTSTVQAEMMNVKHAIVAVEAMIQSVDDIFAGVSLHDLQVLGRSERWSIL